LLSAGLAPNATEVAGGLVARPAGNTGTGFYVADGHIYDANGHEFVAKGINHTVQFGDYNKNLDAVKEFAKTGSNAVRVVMGTFGPGSTPAGRASIADQFLAQGIVPVVEDQSATGSASPADLQAVVDRWLLPDNVAWLKKDEKNIILNIANEWGPNSSTYRDVYISSIQRLRDAGINALIMVDAGGSGQSATTLEQYAKAIYDADPQHNVAFSIHLYNFFRTEGATDLNKYPSGTFAGGPWDIQTELKKFQAQGLTMVVGEYSMTDGTDVPYDTGRAMQIFAQLGIGSLAWSWNQNGSHAHDMLAATAGWQYDSDSDLSAFGNLVINGQYGLKNTAVPASSLRPATINGSVISNDGSSAAGLSVYIDDNNNGQFDNGELSTIVNSDGTFTFTNLPQGLEHLRVNGVASGPTTIALPAGSTASVTLTLGDAPATGTLSGAVFTDTSREGYQTSGETGFAGQTVYLDANNNGQLDDGEATATTDSDGKFSFTDIAAGTYTVGLVLPDGYQQTTKNFALTLAAGEQVTNLAIGAVQPPALGSISGVMFKDDNGNGVQDPGEVPEVSRGLYLDLNNNGKQDSNEATNLTYKDGSFLFTRLPAGTYTIGKTADGTKLTTPPASVTVTPFVTTVGPAIGLAELNGSVSGIAFNDTNGNGSRDTGETLAAGITVYLDQNGDRTLSAGEAFTTTDTNGAFSFPNLPPSTTYDVRAVPPEGQSLTNGTQFITLNSGVNYTQIKLGLGVPVVVPPPPVISNASITGRFFQDLNQNNLIDNGETGVAGATVYLDTNNNNVLDAGETSQVTAADGSFSFTGLPAGAYHLRGVQPTGYTIISPPADVYLSTSQNFTGAKIGAVALALNPTTTVLQAESATFTGGTFSASNHGGYTGYGFADFGGNGSSATFNVWRTDMGTATLTFRYSNGSTGARPFTISVNGVVVGTVAGTYTGSWDKWANASLDVTLKNGNNVITATAGPATGGNLDSLTITTLLDSTTPGSIKGTAFTDTNSNGASDNGDTPATSATIFLDLNNNGTLDAGEPSTLTDDTGAFSFPDVLGGTYHVRAVLPDGYKQSTTPIDFTLNPGQNVSGLSLGIASLPVSISGNVFNDADADGTNGGSDTPAVGQTVYLDLNNNGTLDSGEPSTTTDNNGAYSFTDLPADTYHVRGVVPAGYTQSTASIDPTLTPGEAASGLNLGIAPLPGSIGGNVFTDNDADGVNNNSDAPAVSQTVYLDTNNNGTLDSGETSTSTDSNGNFAFNNVKAGDYHVRVVLPSGYSQSTTPLDLTVNPGQAQSGLSVGIAPLPGSIGGVAFNDADADGTNTAGDTPAAGATVFLDANNNGSLDAGETSTTTGSDGSFNFTNVKPGAYHVRAVLVTGYQQSTASIDPTLNPGQTISGLSLGIAPMTGSIQGVAFNDTNADGINNLGDTAAAGQTIFLDANNNGALDAGETSTTTASNGSYAFNNLKAGTYHVRAVLPGGYTQSTASLDPTVTPGQNVINTGLGIAPLPASISGKAFTDINADGINNTGDTALAAQAIFLDLNNNGTLDTGEASTTTGSDGSFTFTGVKPGMYHVRTLVPTGYKLSTASLDPTVTPGQSLTGLSLGIAPLPASISGIVFTDTNADGLKNGSDAAAVGQTVFLDANSNGRLDTGEAATTTASDGSFSFTGLKAGAYHVRAVLPSGYTQSTTPIDLTLAPGQSTTGLNLGIAAPTQVTQISLQGENGTLSGGTYTASDHSGYTGTGFANFGGNTNANAVWTFTSPSAGVASFTFVYANGGTTDRPMTLLVNGVTAATPAFASTGNWNTWKTVTFTFNVNAGTNTLKAVVASANRGGNIDRIDIAVTPTTKT